MIAALLVIAAAYWGQTPACGQPSIIRADLPHAVVGRADLLRCEVEIDSRDFAAGEACMVALHEYGHLLGLPHSLNPNDVMFPVVRRPAWPCAWDGTRR